MTVREDVPAPGRARSGPRWDLVGLGLLGCLVLGSVTGVVWWLLSPLPQFEVSDGRILFPDPDSETAVAADGWFAICGAVAGSVTAVAAFARTRSARIDALVWLTLGGLLSALVAWWVGATLGPEPVLEQARQAADGDVFSGPLQVSAPGVLLLWPLMSIVVYFALAAGLDLDRRGRRQSGWHDHDPARHQRLATSFPPGGDRFNDPGASGSGSF